jgi:hypothetical protein
MGSGAAGNGQSAPVWPGCGLLPHPAMGRVGVGVTPFRLPINPHPARWADLPPSGGGNTAAQAGVHKWLT